LKLLLTGASGFIGKNFLLKYGDRYGITAVYRDETFLDFLDYYHINIRAVQCDLSTDLLYSMELRERYDACLHLAGRVLVSQSIREPAGDIIDNVIATANLIKQINCKRFIYVSTGGVYDGLSGPTDPSLSLSPTLPYAINKLSSEYYVQYGFERLNNIDEYIILRLWGAYGPHEPSFKIYTKLCQTFGINDNKYFTVYGNGKNLIDAMYIDDVVDGLNDVILDTRNKNTIYDFASGEPVTIKNLVENACLIIRNEKPIIVYEGHSHADHLFVPSPDKFNQDFNFQATTPLSIGLTNLLTHLEQEMIA
jgi:nucleoside-diphosphate-sugar epimerase